MQYPVVAGIAQSVERLTAEQGPGWGRTITQGLKMTEK